MSERIVLLPDPDGPTIATNSPGETAKVRSSIAVSAPNRFVTPRNSSTRAAAAAAVADARTAGAVTSFLLPSCTSGSLVDFDVIVSRKLDQFGITACLPRRVRKSRTFTPTHHADATDQRGSGVPRGAGVVRAG